MSPDEVVANVDIHPYELNDSKAFEVETIELLSTSWRRFRPKPEV